jgi:dCMP deaminase
MKSWDETFMAIAELYAEHSSCAKYGVGAVLTKDGRIISTGYNGVVSGEKHCNEIFKNINFKQDKIKSEEHHLWSLSNEIHAEVNCILYAAKKGIAVEGCTIYVTTQPCTNCSKTIAAAGIKRVVYKTPYSREPEALDFLKKAGIEVLKIE